MEPLCIEKDGEIQCHVHPRHVWQLMVGPALLLLLILFVMNFTQIYQDTQRVSAWQFNIGVLFLDVLFSVAILVPSYLWIWLDHRSFVYIIRKDELVIRKGIIRKRNSIISYDKIRNVQRRQSLLERIFGLCTISIETASISPEFPDAMIPGMLNTRELTEIILGKMHANEKAEANIGDTMRQILSQLKDLNRRDQRAEDSKLGNAGEGDFSPSQILSQLKDLIKRDRQGEDRKLGNAGKEGFLPISDEKIVKK